MKKNILIVLLLLIHCGDSSRKFDESYQDKIVPPNKVVEAGLDGMSDDSNGLELLECTERRTFEIEYSAEDEPGRFSLIGFYAQSNLSHHHFQKWIYLNKEKYPWVGGISTDLEQVNWGYFRAQYHVLYYESEIDIENFETFEFLMCHDQERNFCQYTENCQAHTIYDYECTSAFPQLHLEEEMLNLWCNNELASFSFTDSEGNEVAFRLSVQPGFESQPTEQEILEASQSFKAHVAMDLLLMPYYYYFAPKQYFLVK